MSRNSLIVALVVLLSATVGSTQPLVIRVAVTGETNLLTNFVDDLKTEANGQGPTIEIVNRRAERDYTIVIAQESSLGGAAAAVIALNQDFDVVASVVRSGRMSGKGAFTACAKELAKKLAVLVR